MKRINKKALFGCSFLALGISLSLNASADRGELVSLTESFVGDSVPAAKASYHKPIASFEVKATSFGGYELLDLDTSRPIVTADNQQAAADYAKLQEQGYKGFVAFEGVYGCGTKQHAGFVAFRKKDDGTADVLVAYHGTKSLADLYTDLAFGEQPLPFGQGGAHGGFLSAYITGASAMKQAIAQIMEENGLIHESTRVRVTGHSLGGALATLAGYDLALGGYDTSVVTFGSPRVFNPIAAAHYESILGEQTVRVWGEDDLIPAVVLGGMLGKKHVGVEVPVPASGETLAAHVMKGYQQKVDASSVVEHVKTVVSHKAHKADFERNLADLQLDKAAEKKMRDAYTEMYAEEEKTVEKKRAQSVAHGLKNAAVSLGGIVKSAAKSIGFRVGSFVSSIGGWFSRR